MHIAVFFILIFNGNRSVLGNGDLYFALDVGKEFIAKGMSWMKTEIKLAMCEKDATIADLMVDGANMGVKSLSRYLNEYKAADEDAKNIAKRLIALEDALSNDLRAYL